MSKAFYLVSLIVVPLIAGVLLAVDVTAPAVLLIIYAVIVSLVFWYRAWSAIQDGHERTTPGKAIGFLFIPIFNWYWIFQAWWGFSKDFNSYVERHGVTAPKLPTDLFLGYTILSLVTSLLWRVKIVGWLLAIVALVLGAIIVYKICDGVNAIAGVTVEPQTPTDAGPSAEPTEPQA